VIADLDAFEEASASRDGLSARLAALPLEFGDFPLLVRSHALGHLANIAGQVRQHLINHLHSLPVVRDNLTILNGIGAIVASSRSTH